MTTTTMKLTRCLAMIMSFLFLLNTSAIIINAEGGDQSNKTITAANLSGELSLEELANYVLPEDDIPQTISLDSIRSNGHAKRLREQEADLNSVIFQNYNGTKTLYYFSYPVKYIDDEGVIRDKSNDITPVDEKSKYCKNYAFVNNNNDIKTYFPKTLSSNTGVVLETEDINIKMSPISSKINPTNVTQKSFDVKSENRINEIAAKTSIAKKAFYITEDGHNKEAVNFDSVFGDNTTIRYTPTFEGFKEDIILNAYTGINQFSFNVETSGLSLTQNDLGEYVFIDSIEGEVKAKLGELLIYDSTSSFSQAIEEKSPNAIEKNNKFIDNLKYEHYYIVNEITPNNKYTVTIVVDEDFLINAETVYPVYVDPQITVWHSDLYNYHNGSDNYIQDTVIYEDLEESDFSYVEENFGSDSLLYVGSRTSYCATARTLIDFEWLRFEDRRNPLAGTQINSAKLYIRDLYSGYPANVINAYGVTGDWLEYTAKGSTVWNAWSEETLYDSRHIYYGNAWTEIGGTVPGVGFYDFDITAYVEEILENGSSESSPKGIMLKAVSESIQAHIFASKEYSVADYRPALVVDYTAMTIDQTSLNVNSGNTIQVGVSNPFSGHHALSTSDANIATVSWVGTKVVQGIKITGHSEGVATIKISNRSDPSKYARCTVIVSSQNLVKIYISPANHPKEYTLPPEITFNPSIHNEKTNMENIGEHLKAYLENYYVDICLDKVDRSNGNQSYAGRPEYAKTQFFQTTATNKCLYLALHANAGKGRYTVAFHNDVGGQNTINLANALTDAIYPIIPEGEDHAPIKGTYIEYINNEGEMLVCETYQGNLEELRKNENQYEYVVTARTEPILDENNTIIGYKHYPETNSEGEAIHYIEYGYNIPTVLVETAFFDTTVQSSFLINKSNERLIAETIAKALINHYNLQPRL